MARKRARPLSAAEQRRRAKALDGYLTQVMHTEANASIATFAWETRDRLRTGTTRGRPRRPTRWFR